jgi:ketosteroid isomerase-like protein
MHDHPNALRIRGLFHAFEQGDLATIHEMIPPEAVWHFPGRRGKLAGTHNGRDAIFTFLMNVQALTDHSFRLDLIDVLANDTRAVALFNGHGARNGKTLDNPTCLRMQLSTKGQIVEVWEFVWDLYHVDEFWS